MTTDSNGWRHTTIRIDGRPLRKKSAFAVCIKTDDPSVLTRGKLYKIGIPDPRLELAGVSVRDDEGEAAVYPEDFFVPLALSNVEKQKLKAVVG